jgi:hypothetical protein
MVLVKQQAFPACAAGTTGQPGEGHADAGGDGELAKPDLVHTTWAHQGPPRVIACCHNA